MRDLGNHGSDRRPPRPGGQEPFGNVRQGRFGTNGHAQNPPPGQRFDPYAADEDGPVDLVELQADEELINALSSGLGVSGPGRGGYDSDDRLVAMLASWKADVDSEPIPELVEPDVAARMLAPARPRRRGGFLRPLAAAASIAAVALAAVSIGAHEAVPGDTLWGVSKVLYTERAGQVQAASDLRTGIERVNAKLATGDTAGAQQDLAALGPLLGRVEPGQQQAYFNQQSDFLAAKVAETPPGQPTDPAAPLRNGTAAPKPPATEGEADPAPVRSPRPGTSPAAPSGPSSGSGTESPGNGSGTESPSREGTDPRSLRDPGPGAAGQSDPSTSPTTSPTSEPAPSTEGSQDPTATGPTTRPTASGEGSQDSDAPPSSSGAVSSTPN
ncbi:anti-sigma-D factor RsdA [Pseudonocardia sp. KRD291]|uniref:anti-sigma-D factor RsdA n=1 Tax=Pseudonocardia sp. KRD291 TaxID=2792007 RepID=UPI001C4A3A8D|nr:anti-sigma-D factor RsdA [Pseudonocardia sp. KRD291]MBW0103538.1 hypothetical protein [Pseudonocardia sp. KRD291]